jgi:formylglycine-generating enzyme required for sulfatase activity
MTPARPTLLLAVALGLVATTAGAHPRKCPQDAVKVGPTCVDAYEASVWQVPPANVALVKRIQGGKATLAELVAAGATRLGCLPGQSPYPATFPETGNWTTPAYAVSVPGTPPSTCISWFQADQACVLSGKHLATNEEWQRAAAGTPDGAPCVVAGPAPGPTGTAGCVSTWGAFDLVGNAAEWVADWGEQAAACGHWAPGFGDDLACVGGDGSLHLPGPLARGGSHADGTDAGVFAVTATQDPRAQLATVGFRCAW